MANTVQIELQVDAQGAVQGVRSFDTAAKGATGTVKALGDQLQATGAKSAAAATQLSSAANSVDAFMTRAKNATAAYNAQAARGVEINKLLGNAFDAAMVQGKTFVEAQEAATAAVAGYIPIAQAATKANYSMGESYGVARIGAAGMMGSMGGMATGMARLAATSKMMGPIFDAMMPVAVGVAIVSILADMGEKVYNVYEKYLSLDAAAERFNKTIDAQRSKEFMDVHSIEEARAGIEASNESAQDLQRTVDQLNRSTVWTRLKDITLVGMISNATNQREAVISQDQANAHKLQAIALMKKEAALQHEINDAQIDASHAGDSALRGQARINAEKEHHLQKLQEEQRYTAQQSGDPMAGREMEQIGARGVDAEAAAQTFDLMRTQAHELIALRNEATNSALRGSALYEAEESQAIEELKYKDMDSAAARNAIHEKFHNEEMRRLRSEETATEMIQARAAASGMTGIQKIQAEGDMRIGAIRGDSSLSDGAKDARVAAARQETLAEMATAERSFTQQVDQLADSSAGHQISGFARINAGAQKQLDELQRRFERTYGAIDRNAPGGEAAYQQGAAALGRGQSYIRAGAADQTAELAKRNADETARIEASAHEKFLTSEQQKTAAIQAEYDERLRKYKEELDRQEISQDDYNRRVVASAEERDAEINAAAKQAHAKLAGEFSSLFRSGAHPMRAVEDLGNKAAGNAAASLVQRIQGTGGASAHGARGFFGNILSGTFPGVWKKHGADAGAEIPGGARAAAATSSVFSVGTAQIRVGTAQISFGGGGASGGSGGAGAALGSVSAPDAAATFSYNGATGATSSTAGAPGSPGATGAAGAAGSSGFNGIPGAPGGGGGSGWSGGGGGFGGFGGSGNGSGAGGSGGFIPVVHSPGANGFGGGSGISNGVNLPAQTYSKFNGGGMVGGAGSGGHPGAPAHSAPGNTVPNQGGIGTTLVRGTQQGMQFGKQMAGVFTGSSGGSGSPDASMETQTSNVDNLVGQDGSTGSGSSSGSMMSGGGFAANAGGAVSGAVGLYGSYKSGSILGGVASGAELGMAVAGPIGAAVGAGVGALVGIMGGREKAHVYYLRTVKPQITGDMDAYKQGSMDYMAAYSDMEQLMNTTKHTIDKWGPAANGYYQDTIKPAILTAEQKFTSMQKAGRSMYPASAAQYAVGSASVPETAMALVHQGERIIPADDNRQITRALNVHNSYQATMRSGGPRAMGGSRTLNMHVHAIDGKGVQQFFGQYKNTMRDALNQSYAENSGGGLGA